MGKWDKTREAQGVHPAQGVKAVITEVEEGATGENAATPGCLMYTVHLRVLEPDSVNGYELRDWFVIGTADDKKAKRDETWQRSEAGPGKLLRLMKRAGVTPTDDAEEWMDALVDQEICLHMTKAPNRGGEGFQNRVGLYFRENDEQFVGIGEELEQQAPKGRGKAAAPTGGRAKAGNRHDDDEADETPVKAKAKAAEPADDDEEDEAPKSARGSKAAGKRAAKDPDED